MGSHGLLREGESFSLETRLLIVVQSCAVCLKHMYIRATQTGLSRLNVCVTVIIIEETMHSREVDMKSLMGGIKE